MEPASVQTTEGKRQGRGSLESPELYENVPGHVIPILEREFDDFDSEASTYLAGRTEETGSMQASPRATSQAGSGPGRASKRGRRPSSPTALTTWANVSPAHGRQPAARDHSSTPNAYTSAGREGPPPRARTSGGWWVMVP